MNKVLDLVLGPLKNKGALESLYSHFSTLNLKEECFINSNYRC